jgi:hypothetical protein
MAESIVDVGYDEALRVISAQGQTLDGLRGRAGLLLSAASLVTSFLGGVAIAGPAFSGGLFHRQPISTWGWLAVAAFAVIGLTSLLILWPWMWRFEMDPVSFVSSATNDGLTAEELKTDLTGYHWENWELNQKKLNWLFFVFRIGCIALLAETVAWLIDLRG